MAMLNSSHARGGFGFSFYVSCLLYSLKSERLVTTTAPSKRRHIWENKFLLRPNLRAEIEWGLFTTEDNKAQRSPNEADSHARVSDCRTAASDTLI